MAGYVRQDVTDQISNGNVVDALPHDNEYDALQSAFAAVGGHKHDGSVGEGAPITVVGPVQDVVISGNSVTPKTDNAYDLGSTTYEWKDLFVDGVANIDSLVADTADINAGTIDNTVIGATTPAAITGTTITATEFVGPVTGNVTGNITGNVTGDVTGNADTATLAAEATALETARTIALTGDVTATGVSFDGTSNISLTTVVVDDSHSHTLSTITDAGTVASQDANSVDIDGGTIDDTAIGGSTPSSGAFTTLSASSTLTLGGVAVTSSAAELNILDGVTATASEINALDGVTATGTSLIQAADASAGRTVLELGSLATASEISVSNVAASSLVTEAEGIASNDNDTTIPTSAAVKDYADNASGMVFLATADASSDSVIDFTAFDNSKYESYLFILSNLQPITDSTELRLRMSDDGGSTFYDGSTDYAWANQLSFGSSSTGSTGSNRSSFIQLAHSVGNAPQEKGVSGSVLIPSPHLGLRPRLVSSLVYRTSGSVFTSANGAGEGADSAVFVNAVRFYFSSGAVSSGTITMYGLKNG